MPAPCSSWQTRPFGSAVRALLLRTTRTCFVVTTVSHTVLASERSRKAMPLRPHIVLRYGASVPEGALLPLLVDQRASRCDARDRSGVGDTSPLIGVEYDFNKLGLFGITNFGTTIVRIIIWLKPRTTKNANSHATPPQDSLKIEAIKIVEINVKRLAICTRMGAWILNPPAHPGHTFMGSPTPRSPIGSFSPHPGQCILFSKRPAHG